MRFAGKFSPAAIESAGPSIRERGSMFSFAVLAVGMACLLALLLGTGVARAATGYGSVGSFGYDTLGEEPTKVAIEDDTGYVLVVDRSNDRVVVFESSQPGAQVLTTFGEGELSDPYGIAIDQTGGDVYVSDGGSNEILRYSSDGGNPPTYSLDAGYASPAQGTGAEEIGSFLSALAVDPVSGDLLVADSGNLRVERFEADGSFVESFDGGSSSSGAFLSLFDVATGPDGTIYVVTNGSTEPFFGTSGSIVESFEADGTFIEQFTGTGGDAGALGAVRAIAYEPRLENLLAVTDGGLFGAEPTLFVLHDGEQVAAVAVPSPEQGTIGVGIAVPSSGAAPLAVLTGRPSGFGGVGGVQLFKPATIDIVFDGVSTIGTQSVHASGTVNPHGDEGTAHFEYRPTGEQSWTATPDQPVSGSTPQTVEADISGLLPNREYELRMVAAVSGFTQNASTTFTTLIQTPTVETQPATGISGASATLNGTVNPEGTPSTFYFEYGTTTAYGSQVPVPAAPAGDKRLPRRFSRTLTGLTPGQTYHFRIVGENSAGTSVGEDLTFIANEIPSEGRAYEQVTPVDKQNGTVDNVYAMHALPGGSGVSYGVRGTADRVDGSPFKPRFLSLRGEQDWNDWIHIDPPFHYQGRSYNFFNTLATSEDGTHALVVSNRDLAPGGTEDVEVANLYVSDLESGQYAFVGTATDPGALATFIAAVQQEKYLDAAPDMSWIVFASQYPMLPGVTSSGVYRWSKAGGLELVSDPTKAAQIYTWPSFESHQASADGTRVYYGSASGFGLADLGAYLWEGGSARPISVSEIDDQVKKAMLVSSSRDGRFAFFICSDPLTADTPSREEPEKYLYRFDASADDVEFVGLINDQQAAISVQPAMKALSEDGRSIYFEHGPAGTILRWHEGETKQIAPRPGIPARILDTEAKVFLSPNDRYFVFSSAGPSPDEGKTLGRGDIYLYDAETDEGSCVSCLGGATTGAAFDPPTGREFDNQIANVVTDDGRVFFTTSASLDPNDSNGVDDVYVYKDGYAALVTTGTAAAPAVLGDISPTGTDVFFITTASLVAQDTDGEMDIYDARVGGGFESQNRLPAPPCVGESCQAVVGGSPPAASNGSERASGETAPKRKRAHCKKAKKSKKRCASKGHKKKKQRHHQGGRGR